MIASAIEIPMTAISEFCQPWQIAEFSLFGSVLPPHRTASNVQAHESLARAVEMFNVK